MTTGTASLDDNGGASVAPVRPGELVGDKYRVERTLGIGGMGVVVAAHDELLDRRVAIKFLLPKLAGTDTAVQRFMREARAATRVTSEHVVRLLEIGKLASGTPYFVMEYLEGRDLRAVLREDGPLSPSLAVDYLLQALQAVAEGHLKGIVHRDIKPGNLFLSARADGTALIKVLDFGIAKRLDAHADAEESSLTSSDDVRLGSPAYMPPEQLQDPRDVDTRSDIWSLGATLYELLCGKPPFEGAGYVELVTRVLTSPPTPINSRQLVAPLPLGLQRVVLRCLEKERSLRYSNAWELAEALAPFGGEDARASLSRVTGLHSSSASIAVSRTVSEPGGSATTTLGVAGESQVPRLKARAASKRLRRLALPLGGLAVLGALALVLRSQWPSASVELIEPRAAAAVPQAEAPVVDAAPPMAASSPVAPPALASPTVASAAPMPSLRAAAPANLKPPALAASAPVPPVTFSKSESRIPRMVEVVPSTLPPGDVKLAVPVQPNADSSAGSDASKSGRSEEIERLIEKRR